MASTMESNSAFAFLDHPQSLSILKLAEPILKPTIASQATSSSHVSNTSSQNETQNNSTPAILAADLAHYQDLFSKLRFSYVEQVTKERFLRAITADPPEFVSAEENSSLEEQLKADKIALKEKKQEVREMIVALEEQGRQLSRRYEQIKLQAVQLDILPSEIDGLETEIARLTEQKEPKSNDPDMDLSIQPTRELLREREQELTNVDLEIERLQAALPAKRAEVQRLQDELAPIQMRKIRAVEEAKDARRRREEGGMADEMEEKGRWLRGVETSLRAMLEV